MELTERDLFPCQAEKGRARLCQLHAGLQYSRGLRDRMLGPASVITVYSVLVTDI